MFAFRTPLPAVFVSFLLAACTADTEAEPRRETTATSAATGDVSSRVDVVRKRIEATNAKDWKAWESLHTPGAVRTAPGLPAPLRGAAAMRTAIEELTVTFPDYRLELVDAFGSGDRLVAKIHTRATMKGPLDLGGQVVPATGKAFEQDWIAVLRFEGDRIASIDEFYDNYDVMLQLGLAGSP
jgi:ketosteroid isomerase-like protein